MYIYIYMRVCFLYWVWQWHIILVGLNSWNELKWHLRFMKFLHDIEMRSSFEWGPKLVWIIHTSNCMNNKCMYIYIYSMHNITYKFLHIYLPSIVWTHRPPIHPSSSYQWDQQQREAPRPAIHPPSAPKKRSLPEPAGVDPCLVGTLEPWNPPWK